MDNMENNGIEKNVNVSEGGLGITAGALASGIIVYVGAEMLKRFVVKPIAKFIGKKIENRKNVTKKIKTKPTEEVKPDESSEEEGVK